MQGNFAYLGEFPYLVAAVWDYSPAALEDRSTYLGSAQFSINPYQVFAQYPFSDYQNGQVRLEQSLIQTGEL